MNPNDMLSAGYLVSNMWSAICVWGGNRRVAFTRTATVSTATGWVRVGSQMSRTRTAPSLSKELYPTYRGSMNTVPQLPVHKSGKLASY